MDYKVCSRCGLDKPLEEFTVSPKGKFGVASQCKICLAKITKLRRANPDWRNSEFGHTKFGCYICPDDIVVSRRCTKCKNEKPLSDFYEKTIGKHGVSPKCKDCEKIEAVERRQSDIDRAREYGRAYYASNRDVLLKAANDNASTPRGRIDNAVSNGVLRGIRKGSKNGRRSFDLVGYSLEQLMAHLEAMFEPWMSWDNYGFYGWHIDHIKPLSSFAYDTPDDPQFKAAWALSNLRPLRAVENWRKGSRYEADNDNGTPEDAEGKGCNNRPRRQAEN